jgi:folate-binding protein YgfZ
MSEARSPAGGLYAELTDHRIVEVRGSDARRWLNDLVTGPVGSLRMGRTTRSLLLTPTGRIRADFHVADTGTLTLLQERAQPGAVHELLAPYVLSSDVELSDVSERFSLLSVLAEPAVDGDGAPESVLGPGVDLIVARESAPEVVGAIGATRSRAEAPALEALRIRLGIPRFGVDFSEGALPAEAGLESAIDLTKGCFLGQESVAKVRNLGHPPNVLVALRATEPVRAGDPVRSGGEEVGEVTSATTVRDQALLLATVRWEERDGDLETADGSRLTRRERWLPPPT